MNQSKNNWLLAFVCLLTCMTTAGATPILSTATLDAAQEPGPLSTSPALGAAVLSVEPTTGEFDFNLQITGIEPDELADLGLGPAISSIHLHNAPLGVNGPVVVDLGGGATNANVTPFGNGGLSVNVRGGFFGGLVGDTLQDSNQNLAALFLDELYINVHTNDFRGGAIRGQLSIVQQPQGQAPEPGTLFSCTIAALAVALRRSQTMRAR